MMRLKVLGILLSAGLSGVLATSCSSGGGGGWAAGGAGGGGGSAQSGGATSSGGSGAEIGSGGNGAGSPGGSGGEGAGGVGGTQTAPGSPGAPCTSAADCDGGANAGCLTEQAQGWPGGYCYIKGCSEGSCPSGSGCFEMTSGSKYCLKSCTQKNDCGSGYACHPAGACVPSCSETGCGAGEVCDASTGLCGAAPPPPCTPTSCAAGLVCDSASGKCVLAAGTGPGPGPGPVCSALPKRDCVGTSTYCGQLLAFDPKYGPGYEDYPINGETATNQYRSYARRDMQMLVKYAAAYVDCKAKSWTTGNGGVIGLGDMSEANGAIPGTSIGQPGHPAGTHLNGVDMDIAYFQAGTVDNKLRPVCAHTSGGSDQYHCVAPPDKLDVWRSALFLGALFSSETVRVIGVDGQVGPLVEDAMLKLCASGWLAQYSCDAMQGKLSSASQYGLVYETVDGGAGWYYFHHHHLHLSLNKKVPTNPTALVPDFQLDPISALRTQQQINQLLALAGHGDGHDHPRRIGKLPGLD
jgi:hypothetical protein